MAKDLRDLIQQAATDIDRYKRPDVDEAKKRLDEICCAAQIGGISCDEILSIEEYEGMFHIRTGWTSRGCEQTGDRHIPSWVIDAEDPIEAATHWGICGRLAEAQVGVNKAREDLERAEKKLAEVRGETRSHSPTTFEAFKDLAGRLGWDAAQHADGNLALFRDERLQTIWDCFSRNPAALGVSLSAEGGKASA